MDRAVAIPTYFMKTGGVTTGPPFKLPLALANGGDQKSTGL
jgi:hypothetical protein